MKFTKKQITRFAIEYSLHTAIILFIANIAIYESIRLFSFGQTCMTVAQVQSDSRCLYIYSSDIYQKGTRQSPHHGHPCGSNVTKVLPSSHLMNMARYLDPNRIASLCSSSQPTPTPLPPTPTPTSIPTPTPTSEPTFAPIPTTVPTVAPGQPTPTPTSEPTIAPTESTNPQDTTQPTDTPIPTASTINPSPTKKVIAHVMLSCNQDCSVYACAVGLACSNGTCRKSACPADPTCTCTITPTPTSEPTAVPTPTNAPIVATAQSTVTPTPTPEPTTVPTPTPSLPTVIASQNNLEAASVITATLAELSLAATIILFFFKTKIGKLTWKKMKKVLLRAKNEEDEKLDANAVINQIYQCEPKEKGQKEDTTWIMLTNDKEQIYGFCDFPWKFEGTVTVTGRREEVDGKTYIRITTIHPFEEKKKHG